MALNIINEKLSTGNFDEVVDFVKNLLENEYKFKAAVYIIRKVCDVVTKKSSVSPTHLQSVTSICCLCLEAIIRNKEGDAIEVDQKLTASLFHIARVISKEDYESFGKLICASLPVLKSMPNASDPKQVSTLLNLGILIAHSYPNFEKCISERDPYYIESKLIEFMDMMLEVFDLSREELFVVFSVSDKLIGFYSKKIQGRDELQEFINKITLKMKLFFGKKKTRQDPNMCKFCQQSLKAILNIYKLLFAMNEFELAFIVLKDMIEVLKESFPTSSQENVTPKIILECLSPFLFTFENIPSSGIACTQLQSAVELMKEAVVKQVQDSKAADQALWFISSVVISLARYWNKDVEKVRLVFPLRLLPYLEEFFTVVVMVLKTSCCSVCTDPSGQKCPLQEDIYSAYQMELCLLYLVLWVFNWDAESEPSLLKICTNSIKQCEELLSIATRKKCYKSTDMTFCLCERVYAVAVKSKDQDPQLFKTLLEKSRDLYIKYSKATKNILSNHSTAKSIMKALASVRRRRKESSSACVAVAIALVLECLTPDRSGLESLLKLWSELCALSPDEYVPLLTLLNTNNEVKDFFGDQLESSINAAELYVFETIALGSYESHKFCVLQKCWKTRKGLNRSPLQKIRSVAYFLNALAFCEDFELVKEFLANFKAKEYHDMLKMISSSDIPVALCGLAQLSYCQFFINKKLHQASSKKLVEEAKTFEPLPKKILSTADVVDNNDACDLTPTFSNLTVSKEVLLLTHLIAALKYWDDSLKKGLEASVFTDRELRIHADYLINTATLLRLCGHYLKEKFAWEVCRSFGLQVRNDQLVLRAISGLMDLSCSDVGWIKRAETIAASLVDEPTAKHVLHIYRNSYIVHCFSNDKVEEGAALLKKVLKSSDSWKWYSVKSSFLLARYLSNTPRRLRVKLFSEIDESSFGIARNCFLKTKYLIEEYMNESKVERSEGFDHPCVADLLFSICLWLGYTYLEMMMPRESRCFLKYHLLITQKMGLPVRAAECLSLLGKVDLLVHKIEDSVVKAEGLKQILEAKSTEKEDVTEEIPFYRDEDGTDLLSIPPKVGNPTGGSPNLSVSRFAMPEFAAHKTNCCCFHCSHILLHKLWLDMGFIQASAFSLQCQLKPAKNFFCNAMKLADVCRAKHEKLLNGFFGRTSILEDFTRSEAAVRLRYTDTLILERQNNANSVNQAWQINKGLLAGLNKNLVKDTFLLTNAEEQKISLIDLRKLQISSQVVSTQPLPPSSESSGPGISGDGTPNVLSPQPNGLNTLKTPLNQPGKKRSPLEFIGQPKVVPVKGKTFLHARGAVAPMFHLSDSEDEDTNEGVSEPAPVNNLKGKGGEENKRRVREKITRPVGQTTIGKEPKTKLKSGPAAGPASRKVRESDSDSDIVQVSSDDDVKLISQRLVTSNKKVTVAAKKICEKRKEVKNAGNDFDDVQVVCIKTRETRSKAKSTSVETDKSKSQKTTKASGSSIPVKSTRSRRLL